MGIFLRSGLLLALFALVLNAAESAGHGEGDPNLIYKWVNFAILGAGIGYLLVKILFPAFRSQQKQILAGMADAEMRAKEAAEKAAEIDRRMAGLGQDVAALREKAKQEMEAEAARFSQQTKIALEKIEQSAGAEIVSITKAARQQLKEHAAGLAIELAKQKIQGRLDSQVQAGLISRFAAGLTPDVLEKN